MNALVILAKGFEEIEAVTVIDVLERAGVKVTLGGLSGGEFVEGAHGLTVKPSAALKDVALKLFDCVVMPGGMEGSKAMAASELVGEILKNHHKNHKYIASICAAPIGLQKHGIALGSKLTSYPGFEDKLEGYTYSEENVVVDKKLVTSRGPGTAFPFAFKLVELLVDDKKANELKKAMLVP